MGHTKKRRNLVIGLLATLLTAFVLVVAAPASAQNSAILVDSTGDTDDASPTDGVCRTALNTCTLRAAITHANSRRGQDTIRFNVAGGGLQRITVGSPLPPIADSSGGLTIDGYSQPGSSVNTASLTFNATVNIEVRGPSNDNAFTIRSAENTIRGLAIFGAQTLIELQNEAADGNVLVGNIIGSDSSTTYQASGNRDGILMNTGPDRNTIGTPNLADRNVISGVGGRGIRINHGETSQNIIQNNIIGLDRTGTVALNQGIGIDLQWWTWGNLVGGDGVREGNLISGNAEGGMDFSHSSTGNLIVGNRIGTLPDGRSATAATGNGKGGVIVKDNPQNNYVVNNVLSGNDRNGIWHKQNYTGRNFYINNLIGVGTNGAAVGNGQYGVFLTGHDDVYYGNTVANNGRGGFHINNDSVRSAANFPDELTERNSIRLGGYYNNGGPIIGVAAPAHPSQDMPTITGVGAGEIYGGETCAGCTVDLYGSGRVGADGRVTAGPTGQTGMHLALVHSGLCVDIDNGSTARGTRAEQNACSTATSQRYEMVPVGTHFLLRATHSGMCLDVTGISLDDDAQVIQWTCNSASANQRLRWSGNSLVFEHSGKCLDLQSGSPDNGGNLVQHGCNQGTNQQFNVGPATPTAWIGSVKADARGNFSMGSSTLRTGMAIWATSRTAQGETSAPAGQVLIGTTGFNLGSNPAAPLPRPAAPSVPSPPPSYQPQSFNCALSGNTLAWTNARADTYYVFATTNGRDTYLGGRNNTSIPVAPADSYRVTHWRGGFATQATCAGAGGASFSCAVTGNRVAWSNAGADAYYVFATTNGRDIYLGGHTNTSIPVAPADSFRVTHWVAGRPIRATC